MAKKGSGFTLERVKSGIKGLDPLISGGFVKGNSILICGHPGTGKTLLALQFLYEGAKLGEPGVFVSIEDHPDKIIAYGKTFGWDIEKYIENGTLSFMNVPMDRQGYNIVGEIKKEMKKIGAKRVGVDSLSALNFNARMYTLPLTNQPDPTGTIDRKKILKVAGFAPFDDYIQFTYLFIRSVGELGATTLFITDSPQDNNSLTKDSVSEFACDGVIQVQLNDTGDNVHRTLSVKKMRGGSIIAGLKTLNFTKKGLEVGEFKVYY